MGKKHQQSLKVVPFQNPSGEEVWRITGTTPDGKRIRRNFKTKAEALIELADLEEELDGLPSQRKSQRMLLTAEQISDAEAAVQAIGSRQLSRVVSHYLDLEARANAKGEDLDKAIGFFEGHFREEVVEKSILNAREEFLKSRVGLAAKTVEFYTSSTKHLLTPDPNKLLHSFTVSDIEAVLEKFSNINSKRTIKRGLAAFFNWAVRHPLFPETRIADSMPLPGGSIEATRPAARGSSPPFCPTCR